jgi:RNA polymerase sigma factor (sigma-70 family)
MRTEAELIGAVQRGDDERAFRELYRQHTPAMYAMALRLLARNAADAEDAIQEAWLRAVRGLGGFRGDSTLRTWLVGIAVRCALEIGRRRRRPVDRAGDDAIVRPPDLERLDLEAALAALADGYREIVVLHDVHGYTHGEIAGLLGIDEGTSRSQLSRARQTLRRVLTGDSRSAL